MTMTKKVTHIYFGDHKSHPIILNYLNDAEIQVTILDAPKGLGSRLTRIGALLSQLWGLNKLDLKILHTHDLVSFYLSRFLYPLKNVIFDSHEIYSSYFKFPFNLVVHVLEELATLLSTKKVYPSLERRDLYFIKQSTFIIENLFAPTSSISSTRVVNRNFKSFVYAGLLSPQRCIAELVDLFSIMPLFKLTIYGSENEYMTRLLERELPDNVKYAGAVSHADLVKKLPRYAASFALYRPLDLNNKYPAPTKIFENEYSGIATIVFSSDYLLRLDGEGRIKNTFFIDDVDRFSLEAITDSGSLEKCQPNTSVQILWESQRSIINDLYNF